MAEKNVTQAQIDLLKLQITEMQQHQEKLILELRQEQMDMQKQLQDERAETRREEKEWRVCIQEQQTMSLAKYDNLVGFLKRHLQEESKKRELKEAELERRLLKQANETSELNCKIDGILDHFRMSASPTSRKRDATDALQLLSSASTGMDLENDFGRSHNSSTRVLSRQMEK